MQTLQADRDELRGEIIRIVEMLRQGAVRPYSIILELEALGEDSEEAQLIRETLDELRVTPAERTQWEQSYISFVKPPPGFV